MPVIRVEKNRMYTITALFPLRDYRLSLKAKGLLAFILSLPDNWTYTIKGLAQVLKEGPDAVRSTLIELEKYGYMVRKRKRNKQGQLAETEYIIREIPEIIPADLQKWISQDWDLPKLDNPTQVCPEQENSMQDDPVQSNRPQSNKDVSSNDLKNQSVNQSIQGIKEMVMEQIDYDALLEDFDRGWLDNIVGIVAGVLHSTKPQTKIGGEDYATVDVQSQFDRLRADHIRYVCDRLDAAASNVHNVRAYLLTALYNAVDTMTAHYQAKAKHDLKHGDYIDRCRDLLDTNDEEG